MRRYELGMTLDYCSNWSVSDAVREFFQNAKDEEIVNPDNKMYFNYNIENKTLTIGNKMSSLTTGTLLLGNSSKKNDKRTVGNFGEGYKVATVVLMRNGINVKIYNNEVKEVWTSRVVKSKRYNSNIVVYDIEKSIFKKDYDLLFELVGITEEMYKDIVEKILDLQDDIGEVMKSEKGNILFNSKYSGNIYVNGLYVCHNENVEWGYDFTPDMIRLDRDRGLVDTFDLKFAIGQLVSNVADADFITKNINKPDLDYVSIYLKNGYKDKYMEVGKNIYDSFIEENGEDAYPVDNVGHWNEYKEMGYNPVLVNESKYSLMKQHIPNDIINIPIDLEYRMWRKKAIDYLSTDLLEEIDSIWERR